MMEGEKPEVRKHFFSPSSYMREKRRRWSEKNTGSSNFYGREEEKQGVEGRWQPGVWGKKL